MDVEALLKLKARVIGTSAVQKLGRALGAAEQQAEKAKRSFKNVINSSAWQASAVAATALGTALGFATRDAIRFESAVAGVAKVVEGLDTPRGLREMRREILNMSKEVPIAAEGIADIFAAAGRAGIPREEMRGFAEDVARISIAFELTAEEAGNALAKLRTSLGLTQEELIDLADAVNFLGDNMATTEPEIVRFLLRSGAVGQTAGIVAEQTAAIGAAMIASGAQAEVAATSFNNIVKALSRGESATARQISALDRLGFVTRTVAGGERAFTQAVQRGADRRLQIMQDATDRQQNELRKRYRRQLQLLEDQWSDENEAAEDAVRDQADLRIRAIQSRSDAETRALRQRFADNADHADRMTELVRDRAEREIDAIRDATDRRLKLQSRAARDRQQLQRDALDEQRQTESRQLQRAAEERQRVEKEAAKATIARAKATSAAAGKEAAAALASAFQADGVGTLRNVLERIRSLPAELQSSVRSDLFGDETRALAPLIQNMENLDQAFALVEDGSGKAGSSMRAFERQLQTTASQLQLAENRGRALSITVGDSLTGAFIGVVNSLQPVLDGLNAFAEANPGITAVIVSVGALAAGLVLLAPFVASLITVFGALGLKAIAVGAAFAKFTAIAGSVIAVAVKIGAAIKATALIVAGVLASVAAAPVVVTVAIAAAVAAVVAGVVLFRKEIGAFFVWVAQSAVEGWNALVAPLQPVIGVVAQVWQSLTQTLVSVWSGMARVFYQIFIEPTVVSIRTLGEIFRRGWSATREFAIGIFRSISNAFQQIVVQPLVNVWTRVTDTAKAALRGMIGWAARALNGLIDLVNNVIQGINQVRSAVGLSTFGIINKIAVPAFAEGGFVNKPTLGVVGEKPGQGEYMVPEKKAMAFANNIIAGRRGAAAIPQSSSSATSPPVVNVNLTTGPVVEMNGQRYMTVEDGERMARQAVDQMLRISRTPGGRYTTGVR